MSYLSQDRLSTSGRGSSDRPVPFISDDKSELSIDRTLCSLSVISFHDSNLSLSSGVMGNAIAPPDRDVDAPSWNPVDQIKTYLEIKNLGGIGSE